MKKALITGVTGQDGAYLAKLLISKGYEVHGVKRRSSLFNTQRIDDIYTDPHVEGGTFHLHFGDLTDATNIIRIIQEVQPDEIYNLGAMSHVRVSFDMPEYAANVDALGTLRLLEAVRILGMTDKVRIYQASTSELYGKIQETPQTETTPFYPRSPYAVAKLYAYWITVNFREAYGMYACNGILFNHESPLRGETFVTRKITREVAQVALGLKRKFYLGNLDAKRDWGHAKDYVDAMWRMLQQDKPEDFVIATGVSASVREFLIMAFEFVGVELSFRGSGVEERAYVAKCNNPDFQLPIGQEVLSIDERYFRPTEVELLLGDASKANRLLGWKPTYDLEQLCHEMMSADLEAYKKNQLLMESGFDTYNEFE